MPPPLISVESIGDMAAAAAALPRLPDDVLAEVLRRLEPRSLVASRCVCKPWRDLIDARRRQLLLPLSLAGIFIGQTASHGPRFFARRPSSIAGSLRFLPSSTPTPTPTAGDKPPPPQPPHRRGRGRYEIQDHCNGLLLLLLPGDPDDLVVANPATRWCSPPLPPRPAPRMGPSAFDAHCLVYDPAASSRYEVFSIPCFHRRCSACYSSPEPGTADSRRAGRDEPLNELSEWPPLVWALDVYSSSTGRWEERTFHRQGEAAGTVAGMRFDLSGHKCKSVYWRGALYVHYKTCFIMRMSLSDGKYQVIKTPPVVGVNRFPHFSLGASQKGVYLAQVTQPRWLQVWVLDESSDRMEWALKHEKNLNLVLPRQTHYRRWILQDVTGKDKIRQHKERGDEESPEWSSDDDTIDLRRVVQVPHHGYRGNIDVLGFHPHKEIVFLCDALQTGLAYHINTSKIDNLGKLHLAGSYDEVLSNKRFSGAFFPYTPCWLSW